MPGLTVHDLMLLPIDRCRDFFATLALPAPLDEAADLLLGEIRTRLAYLCEVGLGYLTLDRQSRTLSGGEVQRINLTTALGTSLVNTLFVLDEPSIGLHPRDMGRVIGVMHKLRDAGNSLVVVEHDPQIMHEADRLLDMGPGPGERGGEVVFFGTPRGHCATAKTLTAEYLSGRKRAAPRCGAKGARAGSRTAPQPGDPRRRRTQPEEHRRRPAAAPPGLRHRRLRLGQIDAGAGRALRRAAQAQGQADRGAGRHRELRGHQHVSEVVMVDQTPIGKTTRSNPASYVGAFDPIRNLFAKDEVAKERGYTPGTFSFNSGNGRCPTCGGNGFEHVEMQFLSDVYLRCPDCDGRRFRAEVLEVTLRGKSIAEVLELTVSEALTFFAGHAEVQARAAAAGRRRPRVPAPGPGGAHAVRRRGAAPEARRPPRRGWRLRHRPARQAVPVRRTDHRPALRRRRQAARSAFRQLLGAGHSLVVIEHNLDVIRAADWIIDLGPEGGDAGGELVCSRHTRGREGAWQLAHRQGAARLRGTVAGPQAFDDADWQHARNPAGRAH